MLNSWAQNLQLPKRFNFLLTPVVDGFGMFIVILNSVLILYIIYIYTIYNVCLCNGQNYGDFMDHGHPRNPFFKGCSRDDQRRCVGQKKRRNPLQLMMLRCLMMLANDVWNILAKIPCKKNSWLADNPIDTKRLKDWFLPIQDWPRT